MQPPKKILIVITQGAVGGAQTFVYNLSRALAERGMAVTIGFGEEGPLTEELAKRNIPSVQFKNLRRSHNPFTNLRFSSELKAFLKRSPYDIVQFNSTNALFGAPGAKFCGARTIFTIHGLSVLDEGYGANPLIRAFYRMIYRCLIRSVDTTVFVSKENLALGERLGLSKNGTVIYNGIADFSSTLIDKNAARQFFGEKAGKDLSGKFIIGSIGRLSHQKHYDFLIEAFPLLLKEHPDAVALIVGDGPERRKYERLIAEKNLGGSVFLCGEVANAAVYLKAFDLFALVSRYEGLSMSLIETLFAGLPAIATDAAGNAEIIGNEWCYPLDDTDGFIKKVSAARRMISQGPFVVPPEKKALFSIEKMCDSYLEAFSDGGR